MYLYFKVENNYKSFRKYGKVCDYDFDVECKYLVCSFGSGVFYNILLCKVLMCINLIKYFISIY